MWCKWEAGYWDQAVPRQVCWVDDFRIATLSCPDCKDKPPAICDDCFISSNLWVHDIWPRQFNPSLAKTDGNYARADRGWAWETRADGATAQAAAAHAGRSDFNWLVQSKVPGWNADKAWETTLIKETKKQNFAFAKVSGLSEPIKIIIEAVLIHY